MKKHKKHMRVPIVPPVLLRGRRISLSTSRGSDFCETNPNRKIKTRNCNGLQNERLEKMRNEPK